MTNEEIKIIISTLIDTHNAAVKISSCTNIESRAKAYIDLRLNSVIENCLMVLIGSLSAEQKIPYTDRKLHELAAMQSYLKDEKVEVKATTPITLSLLKTLIDERLEIWESSSDPFLVLQYIDVEKEYLKKRRAKGL